jgi:hypothetical protein
MILCASIFIYVVETQGRRATLAAA